MASSRIRFRGAMAASLAVGFAVGAYAYLTLPDVRPLATVNPESTAFMELRAAQSASEGRELAHAQRWVPYARISQNLKRAVIVAEDAAFWDHEGVDFQQIRESLQVNWEQGGAIRGASTITQQLAKNLYLSPSRNPIRKARELIIARRLEAELSKTRIFEIYLNVIEWGDGVWGAEAAARTYFGVPASDLTAQQAALLAGAIINPRILNPANPTARLRSRQKIILARMGTAAPSAPVVAAAAEAALEPAGVSDPTPVLESSPIAVPLPMPQPFPTPEASPAPEAPPVPEVSPAPQPFPTPDSSPADGDITPVSQ